MVREFKVKSDERLEADSKVSAPTGNESLKTYHRQHLQAMMAQYVIFPPDKLALAICDIPSEDFYLGDSEDDDSEDGEGEGRGEKDSRTNLVTEVWIEPQDGVIVVEVNESKDFGGMHAKDVPRIIHHQDKEVIATLLSLEYLCAMCRDTTIDNAALVPSFSGSNRNRQHRNSVSKMQPLRQSGTVCQVPFKFDILSILDKSCHTEILLSTLIEDITVEVPIGEGKSASTIQHFYHENDRINERLMETYHGEMLKIHDREIMFADEDHATFVEHIRKRNAKSDAAVNIPELRARDAKQSLTGFVSEPQVKTN